jgi:hypothetical protein
MAKFPTRAKTKKARRVFSGPTFIQRSRNESSEQKAIFHNVTGAGRSRVVREFFGLTVEEQAKVTGVLAAELDRRLKGMTA